MKNIQYCENFQNVTQRHKVSHCSQGNGARGPAQPRLLHTLLKTIENKTKQKTNEMKHNK